MASFSTPMPQVFLLFGIVTQLSAKYTLWVLMYCQKMFKTGEIRLSVFDFIETNTSIQRNITTKLYRRCAIKCASTVLYVVKSFEYNLKKYWKGE
jgi:hypothetical protein